jgi:hypothetical protein
MPLFFLLLGTAPLAAQQPDTTQKPMQLETLPSAPARPQARPRPSAPAQLPAPAPTPAQTAPARPPVAAPAPADTIRQAKTGPGGKEKEKFDILKKLFVGGSATLGFQSSSYYGTYFNIGASPLLGYKLTRFFAIGPGLIYQFSNMGGYKSHDYGVKGFGQFIIYKSFLLHAEHSVVNMQDYDKNQLGQITDQFRTRLSSTLVGAGYRSMANERFGMDLYLLLPVGYSTTTFNNSYSPVIRAGFIYHLK